MGIGVLKMPRRCSAASTDEVRERLETEADAGGWSLAPQPRSLGLVSVLCRVAFEVFSRWRLLYRYTAATSTSTWAMQ